MPNLIWELGADSSGYRKEVESTVTTTEGGFRRVTSAVTDSTQKSGEGVKGLQHGIRELKELVLAGGAVELVKRFFELAAEAAAKSKNVYDENASAVRRFSESAKSAKEGFAEFAMNVVGTANRIGEFFGNAVRGAWDYWVTGATASTEATDAAEKGATRAAMALAESKKYAEQWKQVNAEAKQIEAERAKAQREALPLEQQRAQLIEKQAELLRTAAGIDGNMSVSAKARLEARQKLNEAAKLGVEIQTLENKMAEEVTKETEKHIQQEEAMRKTRLSTLALSAQEKIIRDEIAVLTTQINSGALKGATLATQRNLLEARRVELQQVLNKEQEHEAELAKKSRLAVEEQLTLDRLREKSKTGLTEAERNQLNILELQVNQKRTQVEIDDLLEKQATGKITPAERERLKVLQSQRGEIEKQLGKKEDILEVTVMEQTRSSQGLKPEEIKLQVYRLQSEEKRVQSQIAGILAKGTENLTDADRARLGELEKQKTSLGQQIKTKEDLIVAAGNQKAAEENVTAEFRKQVEEAQTLNKEFNNFRVSISRIGQSYDQQSTDALTGVRDRLNSQLNATGSNGLLIKNATVTSNYGDWLAASTIRSELEKVQQELALRQTVQQYAARYGESAARYQYGDTVTQRALSNLADQSNRAAIATEQINQRLNSAGYGLNGPR